MDLKSTLWKWKTDQTQKNLVLCQKRNNFSFLSLFKVCSICKTVGGDTEAAHYCRDCNKHFCVDCIYRHSNTEMFKEHVVKELCSKETTRTVCKEHEKELEALKYFCQSCEVSFL